MTDKERINIRKHNLCILNEQIKNDFNVQKDNRLGCVEIKCIDEILPNNIWQLAGHLIEYNNKCCRCLCVSQRRIQRHFTRTYGSRDGCCTWI